MSAAELIAEEAREADLGDSELGKTRERRSPAPTTLTGLSTIRA